MSKLTSTALCFAHVENVAGSLDHGRLPFTIERLDTVTLKEHSCHCSSLLTRNVATFRVLVEQALTKVNYGLR